MNLLLKHIKHLVSHAGIAFRERVIFMYDVSFLFMLFMVAMSWSLRGKR